MSRSRREGDPARGVRGRPAEVGAGCVGSRPGWPALRRLPAGRRVRGATSRGAAWSRWRPAKWWRRSAVEASQVEASQIAAESDPSTQGRVAPPRRPAHAAAWASAEPAVAGHSDERGPGGSAPLGVTPPWSRRPPVRGPLAALFCGAARSRRLGSPLTALRPRRLPAARTDPVGFALRSRQLPAVQRDDVNPSPCAPSCPPTPTGTAPTPAPATPVSTPVGPVRCRPVRLGRGGRGALCGRRRRRRGGW